MGYDKFVSFLIKNLSNKCYDELYPSENIEGYIISKYIFFDINFIIYKCINKVENDINEVIKLLNCIELNKNNKIKKYLEECFLKNYISFDFIYQSTDVNKIISILKQELDKIIDVIVYDEILNYILYSLYSLNKPYFIKNVLIFFDGIPGYSKILEQRKRRIYNYINSLNRKEAYNKHFNDDSIVIIYDKKLNIKYNYFNYIKNTYSINKNFGPQSSFLLLLSEYLKNKLSSGNKIKLYISNGNVPGEADYKILQYIEKNKLKGDICIHSCDSDFLYFTILYQLKNQNCYMNLNLIKYNNDSYQLYNGKKIIELFLLKYKQDNLITSNNINVNFLYDILFIIQMFGNDLIPDSYELSTEINLSILLKYHYELYKTNNFIININSDKTIDFNNLLLFLDKIQNKNLFTINILSKFFKIPKKIIYIMTEELNFNLKDFIKKLIVPYLKYEAFIDKDNIDCDDIRYKYINNVENSMNNLIDNPIDLLNLSSESIKYLKDNIKYIFDYTNFKDYGLIRLTINYELCDNPYESLYNYIVSDSIIKTNNTIKNSFTFKNLEKAYEEYSLFTKNINVYNYFEILENQTKILFYDFKYFNPQSKVYCKYNIAPPITQIIEYLKNNNYYSINKKINNNKYFNEHSHHLLITPYLLDNSNYIHNYINNDNNFLPNIMNIMNKYIDNVFGIDIINLRNIDPDIFLNNINQLLKLYQEDDIKRLYSKNLLLL